MDKRSGQELLHELAERYGVASDYEDNWGHRHPTSDRTKRAILAAMGVHTEILQKRRRDAAIEEVIAWLRRKA